MTTATQHAPQTGRQQMHGEGLDIGQQLESLATDGNGMIKIGAGGDSGPVTGAYQARTSKPYGSTGFTCSSNSN